MCGLQAVATTINVRKPWKKVLEVHFGGVAAPGFGIAPASLAFGNVEVGASSMLQATVTNTGTAPLVISSIYSSNAQFTFVPNVFPINIAPGANQVFDVTFAPAATGSYTNSDLTFRHNATPDSTIYQLSGTGTPPGLVDLENTFTGSDGTSTIPLAVGLDATATDCIDPALGESDLPPFPPAGVFEIRFDLATYGCPTLSTYKDYRFAADPLNFVGTVQHTLWWQVSSTGLPITFEYNLHPNATMTITDQIGGSLAGIAVAAGTAPWGVLVFCFCLLPSVFC